MHQSLILACHITGVYDVNRSNTLNNNDYLLIQDWANSIINLDLNGVIFHNNFSAATCQEFTNKNITFIKIAHQKQYNPNIYRYFVYANFLKQHAQSIKNLFITDVSDVVVVNNPFIQPLYKANPNAIFCGDEPKQLANDWMQAHGQHLRNSITDYAEYETNFKAATLLNCGIIGGKTEIMQSFINELWQLHQQHNATNKTAYTGDMGAFNYLMRTQFNQQIIHGAPVNTLFKGYEVANKNCWFRHK